MINSNLICLMLFLLSALLTLFFVPLVIRISKRYDLMDDPGIRKVHSRPVSRIGGAAIFLSTMAIACPVIFGIIYFDLSWGKAESKGLCFVLCSSFMFFVGLTDDIKGLRARTKLLCQIAAAAVFCSFGFRITEISITDSMVLNFGVFSWPLTIFWIVGLTNAINFIDGLDGLACGICAITCGVLLVLSAVHQQLTLTAMMVCLLGSLCTFLFFNFNPAKIFMGDSGSLFLGFTIATSVIICGSSSSRLSTFGLPVLALGIPIIDTFVVMLHRFIQNRSMFSPDRGHFHHILLDVGITHSQVVIIAYFISVVLTIFGVFMTLATDIGALMIFVCSIVLLLLCFELLGIIKVHEIFNGLWRRHQLIKRHKAEKARFEAAQLHFRRASTFPQWWDSVCNAAEEMDFKTIHLPLKKEPSDKALSWKNNCGSENLNDVIRMKIPIGNQSRSFDGELEVEVPVGGSLESAGHRLSLFSRLLEEHDPHGEIEQEKVSGVAETSSCYIGHD